MLPTDLSLASLVVVMSEAFAVWVIVMLWRSNEFVVLKCVLTAIAIIPVLGPVLVLWICNFPARAPGALQDKYKFSADVYERWSDVIREKNPVAKFRKWREVMRQ